MRPGDQPQRVAIARALILEPRILLPDEPTSALALAAGKATHPYARQLLRSNRGFDRGGAEAVDVAS